MSLIPEFLSGGMGVGGEIVRGTVAFAGLGTIAIKSVVRVPKNHRGFRTVRENPERTWGRKQGKRYGTVGSGFHLVYPFVGGVSSRSMQTQYDNLEGFSVECTDGKHVGDAVIEWHVKRRSEPDEPDPLENNLYSSLFELESGKLDHFVRQLGGAGLLAAASSLSREELLEPNAALPKIQELYGDTFDARGVVIDRVLITSLGRSEAQVLGEMLGSTTEPDSSRNKAVEAAVGLHIVPPPSA